MLRAVAVALTCAACSPAATGAPTATGDHSTPSTPTPPSKASPPMVSPRISEQFASSQHVIVARLISLEPSPNLWSGMLATFQAANYEVTEVLKGSGLAVGARVTVDHPLVARARTVRSTPELDDTWFVAGRSVVLFLDTSDGRLRCRDANDGVLDAADPGLLDGLRALATSGA